MSDVVTGYSFETTVYSYTIDPIPVEIGGGWRLQLLMDGEVACDVDYNLAKYKGDDPSGQAYAAAIAHAQDWCTHWNGNEATYLWGVGTPDDGQDYFFDPVSSYAKAMEIAAWVVDNYWRQPVIWLLRVSCKGNLSVCVKEGTLPKYFVYGHVLVAEVPARFAAEVADFHNPRPHGSATVEA